MQKEHSTKHIVRVRKRGRSRFCLQRINKTNDRPAIEAKIDNMFISWKEREKRSTFNRRCDLIEKEEGKSKRKHTQQGHRSFWEEPWGNCRPQIPLLIFRVSVSVCVCSVVWAFEGVQKERERERVALWVACERTKAETDVRRTRSGGGDCWES